MLPVSPVGQLIGESSTHIRVLHRYKRIPVIEAFNQPQEFSSGSALTRGFGGAACKSDPELLAEPAKASARGWRGRNDDGGEEKTRG
jgi:hypothetical protein